MKREGIPLVVALVGLVVAAALTLAFVWSPSPPDAVQQVAGGSPQRGIEAIEHYGCGSCHTIPGIDGADGLVGPPLVKWSQREIIAGELPNTAPNLEHWIQDPQDVEPGTAMPDMGVSAQEARDIAAYLYTLD